MGYLEEFKPDLQEFYDKTKKFADKEMTVAEYKGFSGGFGSYAQRGAESHMLRLRMTGGRITKDMLKGLVDILDKYPDKRLKLTTCESIQIHDLKADELCDSILPAWEAGMITRGGGGDFPRNVMCSPLSGVEEGENFNVMPYAAAAGEYLMSFIKGPKFPRKLKCAFSNSPANVVHATIRDLGFVSNPDGTFDVYICGGMGNNPKVGVKAADKVDPSKILYYIKAMVETFKAYGDYENRGRARTRYMQEKLGVEGLKEAFNEKLKEAFASEKLNLDNESIKKAIAAEDAELKEKGRQSVEADKDRLSGEKRVIKERQDGLYAVVYHPIGGVFGPAKLKEIYETIKDAELSELRVGPDESLYIINLNAAEALNALKATEDGARDLFETSVACIGAATCQVGLADSQGLLKACVEEIRKHDFADGVLPRIYISGCPSSCTGHQASGFGFRGALKKTDNGQKIGFAVFVGGDERQGSELLAGQGPVIIAEDIPKFLAELGDMVTEAKSTYDKWITENHEKLDALIEKYA